MNLVVRRPVRTGSSIIDAFFRDTYTPGSTSGGQQPATNITERDDAYLLELAAPGLQRDDFQMEVDNDILYLEATPKQKENDNDRVIRRGFSYRRLKRSYYLPETVDTNAIEASYEAGILRVILPKREEAKQPEPRKIEIA